MDVTIDIMLLQHRLRHRPKHDDGSLGRSRRQQLQCGVGDWVAIDRTVGGMLSGYRRNDSRDSPFDRP